MHVQLILIALLAFGISFAERNSSCVTPNRETAICKPIRECDVIYNAARTGNSSAREFAKNSQCGYDKEPLVCCGSTGYPTATTTTTVNFLSLFMKPTTPAPKEDTSIILANFHTNLLPDRTVCGLEKEKDRIVGGTETRLDEFPWMAALEYKSKRTGKSVGIKCGGCIINDRFVVTAAHCLSHIEFELDRVWLGDWKISTDPDCLPLVTANEECADPVQKLTIKEAIPHPAFNRSGDNDIALIRLEEEIIMYTDYVRPICLPPDNLPYPPVNAKVSVAGWGTTESMGSTTSDVKLKVELPVVSNEVCKEKLKKFHQNGIVVSSNHLCAGGEGKKDSCQGDSGGPLMRSIENAEGQNQWFLEGVVSKGVGCGFEGRPAIYTRVAKYVNWIINEISEE